MAKFSRIGRLLKKPELPPGLRVYVFGDIHGRADLLADLLKVIDADMSRSPPGRAIEVFLGDYIDRGPQSRATLEILIDRSRRRETVFLMGNHEAYLLQAIADAGQVQDWRRFGLLQTLMSYGLAPSLAPGPAEQRDLMEALLAAMPKGHLAFLNSLRSSFTCGDFFFVHAGVRPGVPLAKQQQSDLLWIREEFLESTENFGKYVVHGHTPVQAPDVRPNRINIDTGAYATGNLTLLTIQGSRLLTF